MEERSNTQKKNQLHFQPLEHVHSQQSLVLNFQFGCQFQNRNTVSFFSHNRKFQL